MLEQHERGGKEELKFKFVYLQNVRNNWQHANLRNERCDESKICSLYQWKFVKIPVSLRKEVRLSNEPPGCFSNATNGYLFRQVFVFVCFTVCEVVFLLSSPPDS